MTDDQTETCYRALVVAQNAQRQLLEFMTAREAAETLATFGLMGFVERAGGDEAIGLSTKAIAAALQAQARRSTVQ